LVRAGKLNDILASRVLVTDKRNEPITDVHLGDEFVVVDIAANLDSIPTHR
jgi:hypothetical protein